MRLRILAPALSLVTLTAPPALAQNAEADRLDPVAAVRAFLTDAELLGADSATVGSVTAEEDTVVAADVSMRWQTSFEDGDDTVILTAAATMDRLEVTGLSTTDTGYGADEVVIPEANLLVSVEGADEPLSYDFTITDYRLVDGRWRPFPDIEADPSRPVSRFAPLVDWSIYQSYALNEIGSINGVVVSGDGRQEINYGAFRVGPVVNGALESFEFGPFEANPEMEVPSDDGGTEMVEATMRYGASVGEGLDLKPLAKLLTGNGAADGPQTIIGSTRLGRFDMEADDVFSMSIGENRIEDLTVDASGTPLMTRLDPIVSSVLDNGEPSPDAMLPLLLDVYAAFGVGHYGFTDVVMEGPDFAARMGEFFVEGLSAAGLDLFAVRDVEVTTAGGSGTLGAFEVAGMVFPEREDFLSASMSGAMGMQPDMRSVLDAVPYLGRITVSGLQATTPMTGTVSLDLLETRLDEFIDPIPTSVSLSINGLSVPLAVVPDQRTVMTMRALGADPMTADANIGVAWDEATQDVTLDIDMAVGNVGALAAEAEVGGIPRVVLENPERAQEALATASLGGMTMTFRDEGVTDFLLGMMAEQTGLTRTQFAQGIVQQIQMQGQMLPGGAAVVQDVTQAVAKFLADPQSMRISIAPAAPVPVAQIMGAAMTAPQALPDLLNFSIAANQ